MKNKSSKEITIGIVGAGDVVLNRTLPAMLKNSNAHKLSIYSIEKLTNKYEPENATFIKIIDTKSTLESIRKCNIAWIATPSDTHLFYMEKLIKNNDFIVVEKPITVIPAELKAIDAIVNSIDRERVFFLSYYMLEKALPLVYLANQNEFYRKYLSITCSDVELQNTLLNLGKLKAINSHIIEGLDARAWIHKEDSGGQLLDTMIHNVLITSKFVGHLGLWDKCWLEQGDFSECEGYKSPNFINLKGQASGVEIDLIVSKNPKVEHTLHKGAALVYENGEITADFTKQNVIIKTNNTNQFIEISIKEGYMGKYDVQVDMALSCFKDSINPGQIDGLHNQLETIKELLYLRKLPYKTLSDSFIQARINNIPNYGSMKKS